MIIVDTREQKNQFILDYFDSRSIEYKHEKLEVGDYSIASNPCFSIDRKANIQELIQNVVHDHERFVRELKRATENNIRLLILVQSESVHSIDDLDDWHNYRLKWSPKATTGSQLKKIINTMIYEYGLQVMFVDKEHYAVTLVWLLEVHKNE